METLTYKDLQRVRANASSKAWVAKNKDKVRAKHARYRAKNTGRDSANSRKWRAANPDADYKKRYGLVQSQWDALFSSQGNACATCKSPDPGLQAWHTDHDHKTGVVRGILCFRCNIALGMIGDDLDGATQMMNNFISYLSRTRSNG